MSKQKITFLLPKAFSGSCSFLFPQPGRLGQMTVHPASDFLRESGDISSTLHDLCAT